MSAAHDLDERPTPDLLASVWRYRYLVAALIVIGAVAGAAIHVLRPGTPTATARLVLQREGAALTRASVMLPSEQVSFVAAQTALIRTPRYQNLLAQYLGAGFTGTRVAQQVHASGDASTAVLTITASDDNRATAVRIANTAITAFRVVVRYLTQQQSATLVQTIAQQQGELINEMNTASKSGHGVEAGAKASAVAALDVEAARVRANTALYGDGVVSFEPATAASGGRRSIDPRLTVAGGSLGLLLGVLLSWVIADRNRRLRTPAEAADHLATPVLAELRRDGLADDQHTSLGLAGALGQQDDAHAIAIIGATPGVGTTRTAITVAESLARDGRRVLLVDLDVDGRATADWAGIDRDAPGVAELLTCETDRASAVVRCRVGDGFAVDVISPGNDAAGADRFPHLLRSAQGRAAFDDLADRYDRVVVDTAPLLSSGAAIAAVTVVDAVITVVARGADVEAVDALARQVQLLRARQIGCVFTSGRRSTGKPGRP